MWKTSWQSVGLPYLTRRSASGVGSLESITLGNSGDDRVAWGGTWHLDELFVTVQGQRQYLWRAIDQDGDVIDILVQPRRDQLAAQRFFRKLLKGQEREPRRLVTDKLRSYEAAHRTIMPSVMHDTKRYANNRAEVSHEPIRQRERQMRGFKSAAQAQRFWSIHGVIQNLFRVGRHLLRSVNHRLLRSRSFLVWQEITCA